MDYDIGIVRRRRIISPDECYFAVPTAVAGTQFVPNASVTLTGGNLTATSLNGGFGSSVVTNATHVSGMYYFEMLQGATPLSNTVDLFSGGSYPTNYVESNVGGNINVSGSVAGTWEGALATGNVIGVAVDLTTNLIWLRKNNDGWSPSLTGDPVAETGGVNIAPAASGAWNIAIVFQNAGEIITANFGPSYSFSKPSGYLDW